MSLAGLWGPAGGEAIGTLVLAHPMGKAAKGFLLRYGHADLFRKSGFHVLAFDANGFGASAAASFNYPGDILATGLWEQGRHPALAVGLVGASFGAGWGCAQWPARKARFALPCSKRHSRRCRSSGATIRCLMPLFG